MFLSNKVGKVKTNPTDMSASGLPRNEKSDVRADIMAAAKSVKAKSVKPEPDNIGIGGVVGGQIAGRAEGERLRKVRNKIIRKGFKTKPVYKK